MKNILVLVMTLVVALSPQESFQLEINVLLETPVNAGPYKLATVGHMVMTQKDVGFLPHKHPGMSMFVVLEGESLLQFEDGPPFIMSAGESRALNANAIMRWGANASNDTNCKVLFIIFGQAGQPLVNFVDVEREPYDVVMQKAERGAFTIQ